MSPTDPIPDAARGWIEPLARFGYAANGLVYALVGVLAAMAAAGVGGATQGKSDTFRTILSQPFGQALLGIVAVGFAGYASWCFVQAALDPEVHGHGWRRTAYRVGRGASGVVYVGLVVLAIQLIVGAGGGGGDGTEHWTARLLGVPFGRWLVGGVGVAILAAALVQLRLVWTTAFRRRLKLSEMTPRQDRLATRTGQVGLAARAVVIGLIGGFLIRAALEFQASEAGGIDQALDTLASQPYGPWLLGLVALGLLAFGLYEGVQARWRRIPV